MKWDVNLYQFLLPEESIKVQLDVLKGEFFFSFPENLQAKNLYVFSCKCVHLQYVLYMTVIVKWREKEKRIDKHCFCELNNDDWFCREQFKEASRAKWD